MSALAYKISSQVELPSHKQHPRRPPLKLVPPVPGEKHRPLSVYRRRRLIVAAVATVLVLWFASMVNQGLSWAWDRIANADPMASAQPIVSTEVQATEWVVRPGDTLWGIARAIQPQGDIRPLVDKLSAEYKGKPLQVGEVILIPH